MYAMLHIPQDQTVEDASFLSLLSLRYDQRLDHALRRDVLQRFLRPLQAIAPAHELAPWKASMVALQHLDGPIDVAEVAAPAAAHVEVLAVEVKVRIELGGTGVRVLPDDHIPP